MSDQAHYRSKYLKMNPEQLRIQNIRLKSKH